MDVTESGQRAGGRWRKKAPQGSAVVSSAAPAETSGTHQCIAQCAAVDSQLAEEGATGPESSAERDEERAVLEAIYGTEFQELSNAEWQIALPGPPGAPSAMLLVVLPAGYPKCTNAPVPLVQASGCIGEAFHEASASAVQELMDEWEPSDEGCVYQWAERLREALLPALEEEALLAEARTAAEAAKLQEQEDQHTAMAMEASATAARGFEYLPANPQYGQRRRNFDGTSFDDVNSVEVKHGEPIVDRKSTFQAHAARVTHQGQVQWVLRTLLTDRKIACATHNMFAYRYHDEARGRVLTADNDDDGEDGAGTKLAELLSLAGCEEVFVMVTRWYGGIQLGADRFKHISRAASTLLDGAGWSRRGRATRGTGTCGGKK